MLITNNKNNYHYIFTLLLLAFSFSHASPNYQHLSPQEINWLAHQQSFTVAFDGNFPPYSFINNDGQLEGFSVDVFKLIEERLKVNFINHPEHDWQTLYEAAKHQKIDIVATMVNNAERQQWFNFTKPYIFKSLVIITQADNQSINRKSDLDNHQVALVKDYQYSKKIINNNPSIKPLLVNDMLDALLKVSTNKADAAISFLGAAHFYRTKYLLSNLKFSAIYDKSNSAESISVNKNIPYLASIIDKTLDSIPENELQALLEKWIPSHHLAQIEEIKLTESEIQWIQDHPNIRLGIDPEFAPFEYIEKGKYSGMVSDYIKLLNQRLNLNMQIVPGLSWDKVINETKKGNIDVLPAVGKTEERQKYLLYSEPYLNFQRVIITKDDMPFITQLSDLESLTVTVQANSSHHGYINENSSITPIALETQQQALLAVSGGKADAFIGNVASATYWIRKMNLMNLKVAAPVSNGTKYLHFAIRKDWPELKSILEKGINSITEKQKKKISERWLLFNYKTKLDTELVKKIVIVFSFLLAIVLLWNRSLKKAVNKRSEMLLHYTHHDAITNLPNRFLMLDRFNQLIKIAEENHSKLAMLSINIDDFKDINDTISHRAGDSILKLISKRITSILGQGEILGRLGGDQFLVIASDIKEATDAASVSQKIINCFNRPFSLKSDQITLSSRIGISIYPDDGQSSEELLKHADSATHHAKLSGKGCYSFYTSQLNKLNTKKLEIEKQIPFALERNELYLVYQPKFNSFNNNIIGFEALIRWEHPTLGNISPDEFIPIIEKNGLIENIGMFVLKEALNKIAYWRKEFDESLSMAVNLSPRQFRSDTIISQIKSVLKDTKNLGNALELEITEGILLDNNPKIETSFNTFKATGIKLSLDDFGTGYASMSYLRKFSFDILKIDKEFINNLSTDGSSRTIVSAMIAMAHSLGMKVVAEGVETQDQLDTLKKLNCNYIQGWLLGRPMLPEKIEDILSQNKNITSHTNKSP